jgi:hypothetical protein
LGGYPPTCPPRCSWSHGIGLLATVASAAGRLPVAHDGAAGLAAIKQCGGLALVQDPNDAIADKMPLQALRNQGIR